MSFDKFCSAHNLRYFLSSGTLLGALRHKGFIPWDDDIDVAMPRPDYEKFYKLTRFNPIKKNYLTSVYRKCLNRTCFPYMKIVDTETRISDDEKVVSGWQGLWIDIFPIDGWPANSERTFAKYMRIYKLYNFLRTRIIYKVNCPNLLKYIVKQTLWTLGQPLFPLLCRKMDLLVKKAKFEDSDFVFESLWPSNKRKRLPKKVFAESRAEFAGHDFSVPADSDLYLRENFGDYMTLPPESERKSHSFNAWRISENSKAKTVLTVGVFDLLHYGHFELFRRAKELAGENGKLTVAIQEDSFVTKYKPNVKLFYDWNTRAKMISALRYVDNVVSYTDIDKSIEKIDFDIFAIGEDQTHAGFQKAVEWCKDNGKKVVRLSRTKGISSSEIRKGK